MMSFFKLCIAFTLIIFSSTESKAQCPTGYNLFNYSISTTAVSNFGCDDGKLVVTLTSNGSGDIYAVALDSPRNIVAHLVTSNAFSETILYLKAGPHKVFVYPYNYTFLDCAKMTDFSIGGPACYSTVTASALNATSGCNDGIVHLTNVSNSCGTHFVDLISNGDTIHLPIGSGAGTFSGSYNLLRAGNYIASAYTVDYNNAITGCSSSTAFTITAPCVSPYSIVSIPADDYTCKGLIRISNHSDCNIWNSVLYNSNNTSTGINFSNGGQAQVGSINYRLIFGTYYLISTNSFTNCVVTDTIVVTCPFTTDDDGDGIPTYLDNCPAVYNPDQSLFTFYVDADHDGYGSNTTASFCSSVLQYGYSLNNNDCDDTKNYVHPGALENCTNGIDDDCNGLIDEPLLIATPDTIYGPAKVCKGQSNVFFAVNHGTNITSYSWTLPPGATGFLSSNTIYISFSNTFAGGDICIRTSNTCGTSNTYCRTIQLTPTLGTVGSISGPTNACIYMGTGDTASYSIAPVTNAVNYEWLMPNEATIISGQGTNSIKVQFSENFIPSTIKVRASAGCTFSAYKSLSLNKNLPSKPVKIMGAVNACPFIGSQTVTTYSINKIANATYYKWTVPACAFIISHGPHVLLNPVTEFQTSDTSIGVIFENSFDGVGDVISVKSASPCGTSLLSTDLIIKRSAIATPSTITGPVNVCPLMEGSIVAAGVDSTYKIKRVKDATSYTWSVPSGASIVLHPGGSGINDTAIVVHYTNTFTGGAINVMANNGCGSSSIKSLTVSKKLPALPGVIAGIVNPCPAIGGPDTTSYKIKKSAYATSYVWTVPLGGTIIDHPGGEGTVNDTVIIVRWTSAFTTGSISVRSINNCSISNSKALTIVRKLPAAPGTITASVNASCPTRKYTYSISSMPLNATSVSWVVPDGGTIVEGQGTLSVIVSYSSSAITGLVKVAGINNCATSAFKSLTVNLPACTVPSFTSFSRVVNSITTIENLDAVLYPNPSSSTFTLQVKSASSEIINVTILDMTGRTYKKLNMPVGNSINFGVDLKPGSYVLQIIQGKQLVTKKFIKL